MSSKFPNDININDLPDEYELTVPEAAELAEVTTDYIIKRIKNKNNVYSFALKAEKKGRDYIIKLKDLRPLLHESPIGRKRSRKKRKF